MEQFKRAQVIILPTKEKTGIILGLESNHLYNRIGRYNDNLGKDGSIEFQHLYITSDDEIKEGDKIYNIEFNKIFTVKSIYETVLHEQAISFLEGGIGNKKDCKKIIATTDTSLSETHKQLVKVSETTTKVIDNLPQPSQQFVTKYIEEYNKGNVIKDVLVEYENICQCSNYIEHSYRVDNKECSDDKGYKLKINSKDNTITIKKLKDSWNREEVIKLLNKFLETAYDGKTKNYNKWIEENL